MSSIGEVYHSKSSAPYTVQFVARDLTAPNGDAQEERNATRWHTRRINAQYLQEKTTKCWGRNCYKGY